VSSAGDLVQPPTSGGWGSSTSAGTVSLGAPAQAGSTVLLVGHSEADPVQWALPGFGQAGPSFGVAGAGKLGFFLRPDVRDGEQAWNLSTLTGAMTNWALFELARSDRVTPLDRYSGGSSGFGDSVPTGTTAVTSSPDEIVIAAHVAAGAGLSFVIPSESGFVSYVAIGQETSPFYRLSVSLLFADAVGQFECTAGLSPAGSGAAAAGIVYCLRAAGELPVPPGPIAVV
jgi:hypothetical protein